MKQQLKLLVGVVAALLVAACSSGGVSGDAGSSTETTEAGVAAPPASRPAGDPVTGSQSIATTDELGASLITRFVSADDFDAWLCSNTDNRSFLYGFFDSSGVREGVEVVVSGDTTQSFEWTVVSITEVQLEYPAVGSQVDLTNIQFSNDKAFTTDSSQRGALSCTLETVLENDSVGTSNADASTGSGVAALTERISTSWTDDSAFDIWLCSTESSGVGYVFTTAGAITEDQVAIESSSQAGETVTVISIWRATDGNTLELSQEDGAIVTIGSILFDNDQSFSGSNSKFGRMSCKLDTFTG